MEGLFYTFHREGGEGRWKALRAGKKKNDFFMTKSSSKDNVSLSESLSCLGLILKTYNCLPSGSNVP